MATKNYKTYILIDYANEVYTFVNSASELNDFYLNLGININSLPKDANNILTDAFLVNVKTREEVSIKFASGNTLCI